MGGKKTTAAAAEVELTPETGGPAPAHDGGERGGALGALERPAAWLVWLRSRLATERIAVVAVLVMGALLFLPFLGTLGLWDPWETHYGEVARAMIARDDYVYPYWESAYFFSKPALPLWMIALGLGVVGAEDPSAPEAPLGSLAEWGARIPFALVAIFCLWAVYRIGRQIQDRSTGLIAAFVLASCPQFIFIGKQAMVDMPLVGFLTAGLAFFIAAVFDREDDRPGTPVERALAASSIALTLGPQLIVIGRELSGAANLATRAGALAGVAYVAWALLKASRRDTYLIGFYVCAALAALSKGLLPFGLLGAVVLLYCIFTMDWHLLVRSRLLLGAPLFLLVSSPWYVTLSLFNGRDDEGKTFIERFWLHDNFGRVGAGVHGDRGGVGYFVEQLAYAMFPWSALLPLALGAAAKKSDEDEDPTRRRILIFVLLWGLFSFAFFTMGQTKFHHYIFPAVPAFAILVGTFFVELAERPERRLTRGLGVLCVVLFAVAARDLVNDPQNLVNLFTYKYDRDYPREIQPRPFLAVLFVGGGLAVGIFGLLRQGARALLAFGVVALIFGAWISHHHFNMLSPHWSQAHLFKTFYDERQGNEPIYAYQLNWRGETFYSRNRILQVKESGANERMRSLVDKPGREFIITEQSRFQTLKSVLSADKREKLRIIDKSSNKFYLCVVDE